MSTLAILGGRGMLGRDLEYLAQTKGFKPLVYDLPEFDITRNADMEEAVSKADVIVNCAAFTAVDKAESEQKICRAVNAEAVASLGKIAKESGKYVLHISTDFVFGDDSDKALKETDIPKPLNVYGMTKLEGEKLLHASGCKHAIMRVEWTYGKNGMNFVTKLIEYARKNDSIRVVGDQVGSPTATDDVARAIICFLKSEVQGLYHFAAKGYVSRYEAAKFILRELKIEKSVSPCSSSEFPTPAKRPKNSRFNCAKIEKFLDFKRPAWQDSLRKFLKNFK